MKWIILPFVPACRQAGREYLARGEGFNVLIVLRKGANFVGKTYKICPSY